MCKSNVPKHRLIFFKRNIFLHGGWRGSYNFYIFAPQNLFCPDGEIGRHASLRGWCRQRCASSSLVLGTFKGELAEWSKAHAWKVCKPQKGFESSNLSLSAGKPVLLNRFSFISHICRYRLNFSVCYSGESFFCTFAPAFLK